MYTQRTTNSSFLKFLQHFHPEFLKYVNGRILKPATNETILETLRLNDKCDKPSWTSYNSHFENACKFLEKHLKSNSNFKELTKQLSISLNNFDDFSEIRFENTANPGYPYCKTFSNRKEAFKAAEEDAKKILETEDYFKNYVHLVFNKPDFKPAIEKFVYLMSRPIICSGLDKHLFDAKFFQPWNDFIMTFHDKDSPISIGMSWFHKGCEELCSYFNLTPDELTTLYEEDFSKWDVLLSPIPQLMAFDVLLKLTDWNEVLDKEIKLTMLIRSFLDSLYANLNLSNGFTLVKKRGMATGAIYTASLNTLANYLMFYCFLSMRAEKLKLPTLEVFNSVKPKLYGDDNLTNDKKNYFDHNEFVEFAATLGMKLKEPLKKNKLSESVFLRRIVKNSNGEPVPWRPFFDLMLKLCYINAKVKFLKDSSPRPKDMGLLASVMTGLKLDGFWNAPFRLLINEYADFLNISKYPLKPIWKWGEKYPIDFPSHFPTDVEVEEIYGKQGVPPINEKLILPNNYSLYKNLNGLTFFDAPKFFISAFLKAREVGHNARKQFKNPDVHVQKELMALVPRDLYYGKAGLKALEVLNKFITEPNQIKTWIELGAGPGYGLRAMCEYFPHAKGIGISLPIKESQPTFFKAPNDPKLSLIENDIFDEELPQVDVIFSDMAVNDATKSTLFINEMMCMFDKNLPKFLIIKCLQSHIDIYRSFKYFLKNKYPYYSIFKPKSSSPWNVEHYLVFSFSKLKKHKKGYLRFLYAKAFYWEMARQTFGLNPPRNPIQQKNFKFLKNKLDKFLKIKMKPAFIDIQSNDLNYEFLNSLSPYVKTNKNFFKFYEQLKLKKLQYKKKQEMHCCFSDKYFKRIGLKTLEIIATNNNLLPKIKHWTEIGSGTGANLRLLRSLYPESYGHAISSSNDFPILMPNDDKINYDYVGIENANLFPTDLLLFDAVDQDTDNSAELFSLILSDIDEMKPKSIVVMVLDPNSAAWQINLDFLIKRYKKFAYLKPISSAAWNTEIFCMFTEYSLDMSKVFDVDFSGLYRRAFYWRYAGLFSNLGSNPNKKTNFDNICVLANSLIDRDLNPLMT